jgi:3-phenylpropionate/cinnamic acid dioxygenase small subunit
MATILTDQREIEQFLFREAELLDHRQYAEWLSLFAEDGVYWMPAGQDDIDPQKETSLIFDDRKALGDRVARLLHPAAHSQTPPSRTRHLIGNIVLGEAEPASLHVGSNFAIMESRLGVQRWWGGHADHHLRRDAGDWRIVRKKVCLINNDGVLYYNLTFIA